MKPYTSVAMECRSVCVLAYSSEAQGGRYFRDVGVGDQGRLLKVLAVLVATMTGGALVLLTLEGRPVKPMAFSLSSQVQLRSIHSVLGTQPGVELAPWQRIEIETRGDQGELSQRHGLSTKLALAYHFVIANGSAGKDGEIYASHRWTKQLACYLTGVPGEANTIRICLIVDPEQSGTTGRQARQLEDLVSTLVRYCQIEPAVVWNAR